MAARALALPRQDEEEIRLAREKRMGPSGEELPFDEALDLDLSRLESKAEADDAELFERLQRVGARLDKLASEQVAKRQPVEKRWLQDIRQYYGQYDPEVEAELLDSQSCRLFLNITRTKTNAFVARMQDMLLPTDEKNWGLEHTPIPDALEKSQSEAPITDPVTGAQATTANGAVVQERDVATAALKTAKEAASKMEQEIDDQFAECDYNGVQRRALEQVGRYGTGVAEGPIQILRTKKAWKGYGPGEWQQVSIDEVTKPTAEWVDVWDFFPDMSCPDAEGWGFAFRRYFWTKKQLRERVKTMQFNRHAVERLLEGQKTATKYATDEHLQQLRTIQGLSNQVDDRFCCWKYVGEIDKEDLKDCGCEGIDDDPLEAYYGVVWFCEGIVLKAEPFYLDSNKLPFSIAYCEKDETSPFGWGVPRLMRGEQKGVNAAWRMMHDNSGLSTGPQTVMDEEAIVGADGNHDLAPRKTWLKNPAYRGIPIQNVFHQFTIDSHQSELMNLLNLGVRFADETTAMPQLMQGEQAQHITKVFQGMALLNNNANVVLKRPVKYYDDSFTRPMIDRFYEWNMMFNEKDEIKGDYRPIVKGASVLLERDQQSQNLLGFMQYKGSHWDPYFKWYDVAEELAKNMRMADIVEDEETVKKNIEEQAKQAAQAGAASGKDPERWAVERDRLGFDREKLTVDRELRIMEYATKHAISLEQARAQLAGLRIKLDHDAKTFNAEAALKAQFGQGI